MKKVLEFIKKHKLYILGGLFVIFFFRSCFKSSDIKKLDKFNDKQTEVIDSLNLVITQKQQHIDSFPERIRLDKLNIHMEYDNWISSKDRGQQLMELHRVVKDNIKELQK